VRKGSSHADKPTATATTNSETASHESAQCAAESGTKETHTIRRTKYDEQTQGTRLGALEVAQNGRRDLRVREQKQRLNACGTTPPAGRFARRSLGGWQEHHRIRDTLVPAKRGGTKERQGRRGCSTMPKKNGVKTTQPLEWHQRNRQEMRKVYRHGADPSVPLERLVSNGLGPAPRQRHGNR
jgi:hypothetical protein